jgi:hypothetical protein
VARTEQQLTLRRRSVMRGASHYGRLIGSIRGLLEDARRTAVRAVNGMLVATYWEIGRRIVEFDQHGKRRAAYGKGLVGKLSRELAPLGRGFSERNLEQMRAFHLHWPISQALSAKSETRGLGILAERLRLSWSHCVRLLSEKIPVTLKYPMRRVSNSPKSYPQGVKIKLQISVDSTPIVSPSYEI